VDDRPGGDACGELPLVGVVGAVQQERGAGACGEQVGIVGVVEAWLEHHVEVGRVVEGEPHVGHADLEEAPRALSGIGQRVAEASVAVGGHRGEQPGPVAEVVGGGRVGDASAPRDLANAGARHPELGDRLDCAPHQRVPEVAVVVRPVS
jgi:hypothetical protein